MILIFLLPYLVHSFSWATSLPINHSNYKQLEVSFPKITNSEILYTIRDLETIGQFEWNITHIVTPINQTHDKIVFNVTKWPAQLKYIVYDILITQKNQDFRVYHYNISEYQTHVPFKDQDRKNPYSIVLYPVGFSRSTLTMGFMWMPINISELFVIHYMDHHMGTEINNQNFGDNWVAFCIVFIKKQYYNSILKTHPSDQYGEIKKSSHIPYFVGLQKIHAPEAQIVVKQSASRIIYTSENVESVAIPLALTQLLDTRSYKLKERVTMLAKAVYLVITIVALTLIICFYRKNKGQIHEVWSFGHNIKGTNTEINKPQDLVEVE